MDPLLPSVSPLARFRLPRPIALLLCLPLLSSCSVQSSNGPLRAPLMSSSAAALGSGTSPSERAPALDPMPRSLQSVRANVSMPGSGANGPEPVAAPGPLPVVGLALALGFCRHFRHAKAKRRAHPSPTEIP